MVGNPKYLKSNKFMNSNSSRSNSQKTSFNSKIKDPNISRINNNINNYYNIISDKEIKEIFNNYKNKIQENKNKYKNDLISNDECSKIMKQYMDKNLSLQENCLKKNENNLNKFKNMESYILEKLKLKSKTDKNRRNKSQARNISNSKDINLSLGELIMNSGDDYRLKNEAKKIIEKEGYGLTNINQKWEMSLRRPKNLIGTRKELLNFGTPMNPYYCMAIERSPEINEIISKPKHDSNLTYIGALSSRTNSIQNLFNLDLKKNKTNDDILKNYIKRNTTCETLEVQGQSLIDFEENIYKKLKGKKKILNFKNNKEEVKDMIIYANYGINNTQYSK